MECYNGGLLNHDFSVVLLKILMNDFQELKYVREAGPRLSIDRFADFLADHKVQGKG